MTRYRVIKAIPEGWEGTAQVGDILTIDRYEGHLTLFKGDKAICDVGSEYGLPEYCELIEEERP